MSLLDANIPQVLTSASSIDGSATHFSSTLHQAEMTAQQAQAFHQGDSAVAFQSAHMRFQDGAQKLQTLLQVAGQNVHEGGTEYTVGDQAGADLMNNVPIGDGGGIAIRA